jgi:hypothetical protein
LEKTGRKEGPEERRQEEAGIQGSSGLPSNVRLRGNPIKRFTAVIYEFS